MSWRRYHCVGDNTSRVVKEFCNRASPQRDWRHDAVQEHGEDMYAHLPVQRLLAQTEINEQEIVEGVPA